MEHDVFPIYYLRYAAMLPRICYALLCKNWQRSLFAVEVGKSSNGSPVAQLEKSSRAEPRNGEVQKVMDVPRPSFSRVYGSTMVYGGYNYGE